MHQRPTRIAIITGASSGIGASLARRLALDGWHVGLIARRAEKLNELINTIRAAGGTAVAAPADIADHAATLKAIGQLEAVLGPTDLLIANAGVGTPTLIEPMNTAELEQMIRVNLFGVMYAIDGVLPGMLRRGTGQIAAISSLGSYKGLPGESGYCASKAAVNVFMEGLRIQLRHKGIVVTTICPGFITTPMTDAMAFHMPWLMNVDDAAQRIIRAIARQRKVCNFPLRTTLLVKLARWLPDRVMVRIMRRYSKRP